ncbi:hypothetical protein R3P38DRAFT_2505657 [Favolaschia claudopus]|uniref:Uncharacterized protein n=1 Tax=Favolaschia claudopus TaxID=2862362 RepID=A0AAW0DBR8_9AGAR
MAPLAGRPPFATDEPDTFYQTSPQPRLRAPQQQPPANRTSAYDVYDNYLSPGESGQGNNRNSGVGALGMGFMNGNMDDDSDDDDEDDMRRARTSTAPSSPSKHAALAAATGVKPSPSKGAFVPERFETPPPQYNNQQRSPPQGSSSRNPPPQQQTSPAIAAPRPGYANAVPALNQSAHGAVARPPPAAAPHGRDQGGHPNLRIAPPAPGSPYGPGSPFGNGTPSPSGSPHPLQAPLTPITPVFARPQRSNTADSAVSFSDTKNLIMRGEGEETLIPRGRGQKGDQFWRRFSMVAKDPDEKKPSKWLTKSQDNASRRNRWVWVIGIILVIAAAGGIGIGVYLSEQGSEHYRPDAIGGSANQGTTKLPETTEGAGVKGAIGGTSTPHVSPTNTVARRDILAPQVTPLALHAARSRHKTARLEAELL